MRLKYYAASVFLLTCLTGCFFAGKKKIDSNHTYGLLKKTMNGDMAALSELCSYINNSDKYDLAPLEITPELKSSCGDIK